MGNAQNQALNTLLKQIDLDYQKKQNAIRNASDYEVELRAGIKDARAARRELLQEHDHDHLARLAVLTDEAALAQKKAQTDAQKVAAQQTQAALSGEYAKVASASLQQATENRLRANDQALRRNELSENLAFHRAELGLRASEAEARRDAKAETAKDKDEKEIVRDETGTPIGRVPTGRGGAQAFATRDADLQKAINSLQALRDDVAQHGGRVASPEKSKRRTALYNNAVGAVVTVSPMGKTNEALEIEKGSIGSSGAVDPHDPIGVATGANLEAIERKLEEAREMRERYRLETLRPLKEGESAAPAHREAPARKPPAETPKSTSSATSKPSQAKVDLALQALEDKSATAADKQRAVQILTEAGIL